MTINEWLKSQNYVLEIIDGQIGAYFSSYTTITEIRNRAQAVGFRVEIVSKTINGYPRHCLREKTL